MDFLNKRLRDEIIALRKSIDAIRDEYKTQNEDRRKETPQPVVVQAELQVPEAAERDHAARDDRAHRQQILLTVGTWLAFCAAARYAGLAACQLHTFNQQLKTMNNTYAQVQTQTGLMQHQIVGTMAAVVGVYVEIDPRKTNEVMFNLTNSGHVISEKVETQFQIFHTTKDGTQQLSKPKNYSATIPQLIPGPGISWQRDFQLGSEPSRYYSNAGDTFTIKGTLHFDNGFGTKVEQPYCFTYIGKYKTARPPLDAVVTEGDAFLSCEDFKSTIEYLKDRLFMD